VRFRPCRVGGGASDFSLIRVEWPGDLLNFTRTPVGKHLLLIDVTAQPPARLTFD